MTKTRLKVLRYKADVAHCWFVMCVHDGIDPKSKFVVFSNDNPFQADYAAAMADLQAALKADRATKAVR